MDLLIPSIASWSTPTVALANLLLVIDKKLASDCKLAHAASRAIIMMVR